MRLLIAVGCNAYSHLNPLRGAEEDAKRIWNLLITASSGAYHDADSRLLLSPSLADVRASLRELPTAGVVDVLTVYFAGHGGTKSGSYYLCLRDTKVDKLSTTGLSFNEILGVITEVRPRQANLIVDACQSAGGMYDFATVLREEALEAGTSLAITVFAACASREGAKETPDGGLATTELLRYLDGEEELQSGRPFLDLIEVGRAASAELSRRGEQTPVVWGVNLTGAPEFAANPHFDPASAAATATHIPPVVRRKIITEFGDAIARLHAEIRVDASGYDIVRLLTSVLREIEAQGHDGMDFIEGVTTSLLGAAAQSRDLLAPTTVIDSVLAVLMSAKNEHQADGLIRDLFARRDHQVPDIAQSIVDLIPSQNFAFLNHKNVLGDLFFLPVRATGVMGWAASAVLVDHLLHRGGSAAGLRKIGEAVTACYPNAVVAMADQQAPAIYVFVEACRVNAMPELAELVLGCLYTDLIATEVSVARPGLDGRSIFRFLQERAAGPGKVAQRLRANPSDLLSAVLLCAANLELDDLYDEDLIYLDHQSCNFFVPATYNDFGREQITEGVNFGFDLGHTVWTLDDGRRGFAGRRAEIMAASRDVAPHRLAAAVVASLVMPDRLPLFLSCAHSEQVPTS